MKFEEKMKRLEKIVAALAEDAVPLDEAMELYKEGAELVKSCDQQLEKAEQQFEELSVPEELS